MKIVSVLNAYLLVFVLIGPFAYAQELQTNSTSLKSQSNVVKTSKGIRNYQIKDHTQLTSLQMSNLQKPVLGHRGTRSENDTPLENVLGVKKEFNKDSRGTR